MEQTLRDLMDASFALHASRPAIRVLRPGPDGSQFVYEALTYARLQVLRDQLASGLHRLGLRRGRRIGILTEGSEHSLLLFLAADSIGTSCVPLCPKAAPEVLIHSINHSAPHILVVDRRGLAQFQRIASLLEHPPRLVWTDGVEEPAQSPDGLAWSQLLSAGAGAPPPQVQVRPEDESKVMYTSGSSGLPKGVVQTHANIVANLQEVWDLISPRPSLRLFKSAPDYHSLGVLNIYYPLAKGWTLDLGRSPERILSDIRLAEPEGLLTVPLILDKVYGGVRQAIAAGGVRGQLVERAVAARGRLARGQATLADRLFHAAVGRRVIGRVREQLASRVGRHLELLVVGSAKADPEALDFFHEVLGITTFEGYGVTECAPLIATNHLRGRRSGTVGRPLIPVRVVGPGGVELGCGDPHTGHYAGTQGRAGELWVSGPNVMQGYLGEPDETARVLVEDEQGHRWYRTGDLFSMDDDGFLTFRGRLGRQFKLRNGEFVNPEMLERVFSRAPLVEHVLVYGDPSQPFPLPLVTVSLEAVQRAGIPDLPLQDEAAWRTHPALSEAVRDQILREATRAGLPAHDRPPRVLLLPESLAEENGTLTKGLRKVIPTAVVDRYRELIEQAYAG
ncbi:MAG: AMP-binding protein [Candidatus Latescibacterota bacterium]